MSHETAPAHHPTTLAVLRLFDAKGGSQYGREAVTQREHALQAAALAERDGASASLIAAALLHDLGHLLHELPEDAPDEGVDDRHEELAASWLATRFGPEVAEPVRLHVEAKRYLCAIDPAYHGHLSAPSRLSLELQGGPMSESECEAFEASPMALQAVALRRWDDAAKEPGRVTPPIDSFARSLDLAAWDHEKPGS
jgi:phosphonate degradation associated HDIG domain protein